MPSRATVIEPLERRRLLTVPGGGVAETVVASGLDRPTAIAIPAVDSDAPVLVGERGGRVVQFRDGRLSGDNSAPIQGLLDDGNLGLLGIAVSKTFGSDRVVYVNYTASSPAPHQRISRFLVGGSGLALDTERVLLDLPAWDLGRAATSVGGGIRVAADGTLLVGVGDGGSPDRAGGLDSPFGKILRLRPDGTAPANNPFADQVGDWAKYVWARGLHDPASFGVQPLTGQVYINDRGDQQADEIDAGVAGANYGWPGTEGGGATSPGAVIQGPVASFPHASTDASAATVGRIAGGAWVISGTLSLPAPYGGDYLFADAAGGTIRALGVNQGRPTGSVIDFATDVPGPVDLGIRNEGDVYCVAAGGGGSSGMLIRYSGTGGATIVQQPADATVGPGRAAILKVVAVGNGTLRYQWMRDDAPIPGATQDTYTFVPPDASLDGAKFSVRVTTEFGEIVSRTAVVHVVTGAGGTDPGTGTGGSGGTGTGGTGTGGTGTGGAGTGGTIDPWHPFGPPPPPPPPQGLIDLLPVVQASLPPAVVGGAGAVGRATVKVFNLGTDTARGTLAIQLRLSANGTADLPDAVLTDVSTTIRIKPGSAKPVKVKFTYPDVPEGSYFLVAEVDPQAVLTETNEVNNIASSATPVRISRAEADVRTLLGATPTAVSAGGSGEVPVAVYNDGNVTASGEMTVRLYAVPTGTPPEEAPAVGVPLAATPSKLVLAPGKRGRTVKARYTLPADLAAGVYDLVASVDAGAGVGEIDTVNNVSVAATSITVG